MSIRISKNIDDNSIKYSNGLQSMEALIGSMVSSINEPVKHKCKKVRRYMQAFEFFVQPLTDFETELRLWEFIKLQIPILSEINVQNLVLSHQIYTDDTTPDLLA